MILLLDIWLWIFSFHYSFLYSAENSKKVSNIFVSTYFVDLLPRSAIDAETWLSLEHKEDWLPVLETGADPHSEGCFELFPDSLVGRRHALSSSVPDSFGGRCFPNRIRFFTLFRVELLFLSGAGDFSGVLWELARFKMLPFEELLPGVLEAPACQLPRCPEVMLFSKFAMFCSISINICCSSSIGSYVWLQE